MSNTFKHIYLLESPIDFWDGATIAEFDMTEAVLEHMPESPRTDIVYKLMMPIPGNPELQPVYLCKADNNGDTYLFSDCDIKEAFSSPYGLTE